LLGLASLALPFIDLGSDVGRIEFGELLFAEIGLLVAGLLFLLPFHPNSNAVKRVALGITLMLLFTLVEARKGFMDDYDMKEIAVFIKSKMDEGIPVANIGKYHGQYQFLGRLEKPIVEFKDKHDRIGDFKISHPDALFISYQHKNENTLPEGSKICFSHDYRGKEVVLWQMGAQLP
jgi:hypothetical protein